MTAAHLAAGAPAAIVPRPYDPAHTACFSIQAAAEPGVLPRVLELFAKRGLVPTQVHASVSPAGELTIDVQMHGMARDEMRYVAVCLRNILEVDCVLTSERHVAG